MERVQVIWEVHLSWIAGYFSLWDEFVTYVHQAYNQALHSSTPRQALSRDRFKLHHDKHQF